MVDVIYKQDFRRLSIASMLTKLHKVSKSYISFRHHVIPTPLKSPHSRHNKRGGISDGCWTQDVWTEYKESQVISDTVIRRCQGGNGRFRRKRLITQLSALRHFTLRLNFTDSVILLQLRDKKRLLDNSCLSRNPLSLVLLLKPFTNYSSALWFSEQLFKNSCEKKHI